MGWGAAIGAGSKMLGGGGGGGMLNKFTAKRDRRDDQAERRQDMALNAGDEASMREQAEAANDLASVYARGGSAGEQVTSGLAIQDDVGAIGGESLRNQLMQDAGYNPMMQFNPYVQQFDYSSAAEAAMRDYAEGLADSSISDWEGAQRDMRGAYDQSLEGLQGERDRKADAFDAEVGELEADQREIDAKEIVEMWAASEKRGPNESHYKAQGKLGRDKGADNAQKSDLVQTYLSTGKSYVDILENTGMGRMIGTNPDTQAAFAQWGEN